VFNKSQHLLVLFPFSIAPTLTTPLEAGISKNWYVARGLL